MRGQCRTARNTILSVLHATVCQDKIIGAWGPPIVSMGAELQEVELLRIS